MRRSVATLWRTDLVEGNKQHTQHWKTKELFYEAAEHFLRTHRAVGKGELRQWITGPRGLSVATFYTVTGNKALHPLLRAYAEGGRAELAEIYRRTDATVQLVNEARVAKYWDRRQGWLRELESFDEPTTDMATTSLIRLVRGWSADFEALAGWPDFLPPVCAVEDLMILRPTLKVEDACELLTRVVRRTLGPDRMDAHEVLQMAQVDLRSMLPERVLSAMDIVRLMSGLAARLAEMPQGPLLEEPLKAAIICLEDALARVEREYDDDD